MKIRTVSANNRRKAVEVKTASRTFFFPFSKLDPEPRGQDRLARISVDAELGREGFTYALESGKEGSVHIDQVLDYNKDPAYLRDALLYELTLEAQKRVDASPLTKREIIRRLGTSAAQLYRLLDQTNYRKSLDQVLRLLQVLECEVTFKVKARSA